MSHAPADQDPPKKELVISYLLLRRLIGILGISLPFLLAVGTLIVSQLLQSQEHWIQPSISHYYYSFMHVVFVGVLCLLSGFLFCYEGKHKYDRVISNLAAAFALGVAAFPTNCEGFIQDNAQYIVVPSWRPWINGVHYSSAASLFICFAFFCFKIFQDDDGGQQNIQLFDDKKKRRNLFYKRCGIIILLSIGMIGALTVFDPHRNKLPPIIYTYNTIFFETTALLAFGSSWLLKGTYRLDKMPKLFHPLINHYR